jgi:ABC-type Fe3+/spermidine/putrescine transport system ATPase subunit
VSETGPTAIEVRQLDAGYGNAMVLHALDLAVREREFMAILGSSGCGKTTLLRAIAGFHPVFAGQVLLFGQDVTRLPPEKRNLAMVFQSYALWPHMNVFGNLSYGLKLRGQSSAQIASRVEQTLALLGLAGLGSRPVAQLSGGQRQRVALGRALAVQPRILLLDEPLSNLDAKVRVALRYEMKALQQQLGFAALHVTHDREEAMTMADRIVILDGGRVAQLGTPEEVYDRPASAFVASFMGADNHIALDVRRSPEGFSVHAPGLALQFEPRAALPLGACHAYFREADASMDAPDARHGGDLLLPARVAARAYLGGQYRYEVEAAGQRFCVNESRQLDGGSAVSLRLPLDKLHVFPVSPSV